MTSYKEDTSMEAALSQVIHMRNDLAQDLYKQEKLFCKEFSQWKPLLSCGRAWWWGNLDWIKNCPQRFDNNLLEHLPCMKPDCCEETNSNDDDILTKYISEKLLCYLPEKAIKKYDLQILIRQLTPFIIDDTLTEETKRFTIVELTMVVWLYIYDGLTDEKKNGNIVTLEKVEEYRQCAEHCLLAKVGMGYRSKPMERSAMDLGQSLRDYMSKSEQDEIIGILLEYLKATCTEAEKRQEGKYLDEANYIETRDVSCACKPCITASAMMHPSKLWKTLTPEAKTSLMDIIKIVGRLIWLDNDICGWSREAAEDDVMNLVLLKRCQIQHLTMS